MKTRILVVHRTCQGPQAGHQSVRKVFRLGVIISREYLSASRLAGCAALYIIACLESSSNQYLSDLMPKSPMKGREKNNVWSAVHIFFYVLVRGGRGAVQCAVKRLFDSFYLWWARRRASSCTAVALSCAVCADCNLKWAQYSGDKALVTHRSQPACQEYKLRCAEICTDFFVA